MVSACHRNVHMQCLLTTITHLLLSSSACRTVTELELYQCCIDVRAPKFWTLQSRWFFLCFPSLPLSFSPSSFSSFHSLPCLSSFPILPFLYLSLYHFPLLSFPFPVPSLLPLLFSYVFPSHSPNAAMESEECCEFPHWGLGCSKSPENSLIKWKSTAEVWNNVVGTHAIQLFAVYASLLCI